MKCMFCQGTMQKGFAPFHVDRHGYHITFDNVPAWVCGQCGEPSFEAVEVDEIQKAISDMDRHAMEVNRAA